MKPQVPWLRVFVEGVVIVGSILLAFGLQAWWDELGRRDQEQMLINGLSEDLREDSTDCADFLIQHSGRALAYAAITKLYRERHCSGDWCFRRRSRRSIVGEFAHSTRRRDFPRWTTRETHLRR